MGAKQSKRSVDISGKEAEGAGEVAAAGAGGEGRMEPLADVDALKPQANGEAHIHEQQTEKEKQLDSGTPENEKDATTEKENKEQENDKEKEATPLTNGDGEPKENGDSTPAPEDGKKPKKEKVKKKWSLRSISFSRKDKPKQEKKQKDEEPKTNGEAEKVAEEATEVATPETVKESPEETKSETAENKEAKTPETPVTEPLTNGTSTPETPKVESPAAEEPAPVAEPAPESAPEPVAVKEEPKVEPEPDKLPINGMSLEETNESPSQKEECKPAEPASEIKETVAAPEIPVKIEVCVEHKPVESSPPPLPANPPPSSAASFAASTMTPELDSSLLTNTEAQPAIIHALGDKLTNQALNHDITELAPPSKVPENIEPCIVVTSDVAAEVNNENIEKNIEPDYTVAKSLKDENELLETDVVSETESKETIPVITTVVVGEIASDSQEETITATDNTEVKEVKTTENDKSDEIIIEHIAAPKVVLEQNSETIEVVLTSTSVVHDIDGKIPVSGNSLSDVIEPENLPLENNIIPEAESEILSIPTTKNIDIVQDIPEMPEECDILTPEMDSQDSSEELPPPPPPLDDGDLLNETVVSIHNESGTIESVEAKHIDVIATEEVINSNGIDNGITNGNITEHENLKNKSKDLVDKKSECNGNTADEPGSPDQPRPSSQESLPVSDKIADLIPEVPAVPDLNTETETAIAVDN